ncbi:MAG: AMP-binding protein [Opitutaceae bacterium]|nr:AMP-binding protein [Opitutaceae bacterium]
MSSPAPANIARHLSAMAAMRPDCPALKIPRGRLEDESIDYLTLSFSDLDREVDAWVARFRARGVRRGDRTLVMVRQGLPLIASVFALFKLGAVPVVIDPGMGLRPFLRCVRHTRPRVLLGIPFAMLISRLALRAFSSISIRIKADSSLAGRITRPGGANRFRSEQLNTTAKEEVATGDASELAAILFTSGSTGAPKGVCYTHGMFDAQVTMIRDAYAIEPGEIDLPLLPVFALFNPALGMTTVVPEINPGRPSKLNPAAIVRAIRQEGITNSFGSPTLWRIIAEHAAARSIALPSLRRVLCAGAPVPPVLWELARDLLPNGQLHSPYGATEALPVSTISGDEVLAGTASLTREGAGTCVGHPMRGSHHDPLRVKILRITDGPIASMETAVECAPGEIGEIVVNGPPVTQSYDGLPVSNTLAKIPETSENSEARPRWHRMGDCGYLDGSGRLWFCGRRVERVVTTGGIFFTEQVEPIFNQHPSVRRSALVGVGPRDRQQPIVVVELKPGAKRSASFERDLRAWALEQTARVDLRQIHTILIHPGFPVDVRHNAKIHRLTLARWAGKRLKL